MKVLLLILAVGILFTSCSLPPIGDANPLDVPGAQPQTVESIHADNIKAIIRPVHPW